MIVKDMWGKERNAKYFQVEVIRGYGEGENGKKVVILNAISHYWDKIIGLKKTSHVIERKIITSLSTLDDVLALQDNLRHKQDIIDKEVEEWVKQNPKRTFYDEKAYMVKKGYAIYEEDETKFYRETY